MRHLISLIWNRDERRIRALWRVAVEMVSAVLLVSLFQSLTSFDSSAFSFAMQNSIIMGCLLLVALLAGRVVDRRHVRDFGLTLDSRWARDLVGGAALGAGLVFIVFFILYQQGWLQITVSDLGWPKLVRLQTGWVITIMMVAFAEEIMFRGYQFKNLSEGLACIRKPFGVAIAMLAGSVIFGAVHGANPAANLITSVSILFAGVMLCVGRLCTGSLAAPIGLHFAWNYGLAAVLGLPVSGTVIPGSLFKTKTENNAWTGGDFGPEASPVVILCMAIGTIAFVCWPRRPRAIVDNLDQLQSFASRNAG